MRAGTRHAQQEELRAHISSFKQNIEGVNSKWPESLNSQSPSPDMASPARPHLLNVASKLQLETKYSNAGDYGALLVPTTPASVDAAIL